MRKRQITLSRDQVQKCFERARLSLTANTDGSCKAPACRGMVVKKVLAASHGIFMYSCPECTICGKKYIVTDRVIV